MINEKRYNKLLSIINEMQEKIDLVYRIEHDHFIQIKVDSAIYGKFERLIIFERLELFRNMKDFRDHYLTFNNFYKNRFKPSDIYIIPFFAGVNIYELNYFLFMEMQDLGFKFDMPISFDIFPADFNCKGVENFIVFLNFLKQRSPVFKGYNIDIYEQFFIKELRNRNLQYSMIFPKYAIEFEKKILNDEDGTLNEIIKRVKEKNG
jgi:hypothetical protein